MDKRNFISVTLLISALALNPLLAEQHRVQTSSQLEQNRVTTTIASILHKRGLDEDVAKEISENLVNEDDELFALMIDNLINGCNEVNENEVLEYLSTAALHRKNVQLDSYAELVSMVSRIKQNLLDEATLKDLSAVAKRNAFYLQSFRLESEKVS